MKKVALLAALMMAAPVSARPIPSDHESLLNALAEGGVSVYVNGPPSACSGGNSGAYLAQNGRSYMAICQDNRVKGSTDIVGWTDNDLDTIRHEGVHAIQDCMVGRNSDGVMSNIFDDQDEVKRRHGMAAVARIVSTYSARGADLATIDLEVEAFFIAENATAGEIETLYRRYCM